MEKTTINGGGVVLCDVCNRDGDEPGCNGGGLVGSYAVCPECLAKIEKEYPTEIEAKFDPEKSFGDNVRDYRRQVYGTSDCIIEIWGA